MEVCGAVQTHLRLGAVDDPQERAAERIADQAVAAPAPSPDALPGGFASESATSSPSRGNVQDRGQRSMLPAPPVVLPENTQSVLRRLPESAGRPLDRGTRSSMEPRLGIDLSGVRVHDDSAAAEMAQNLGARAFTLRQHIFFNRNEHAPSSPRGRRLLAHELAHVSQQADPSNHGVIRRAVIFKDGVESAQTKVVDREGKVRRSGQLIDEFITGLARFFGIAAKRAYESDGVHVKYVSHKEEHITSVASAAKLFSFLQAGGEAARKILVPKPLDPGESHLRTDEKQDYAGVDWNEIYERYRFVRNALIKRLGQKNLTVERSTTAYGKAGAIRYQASESEEDERVEVTPEHYSDYTVYERSGWNGFWMLTHEILHGEGRHDDEAGNLLAKDPYAFTTKGIDLRDHTTQKQYASRKNRQNWTTVGQPEYDLNMVRLLFDQPLRTGYTDATNIRFADESAPSWIKLEEGAAVPYAMRSGPGISDTEFVGADISGGNKRMEEEANARNKALVEAHELARWKHYLRRDHGGEYNGQRASFTFELGDGSGVMLVRRAGKQELRVEVDFEVVTSGHGAMLEVLGFRVVESGGDRKNSLELPTTTAEDYRRTVTRLAQGGVVLSGRMMGVPVTLSVLSRPRRSP